MAKTYPVSPKQSYWIEKMLAEKDVPAELLAAAKAVQTGNDASEVLDKLFKLPKAGPQVDPKDYPQPGYYVLDGAIYLVKASKNAGRVYATTLVLPPEGSKGRARWDYVKGAIARLVGQEQLTSEQAAAWGHLNGYCFKCGDRLDHPLSVKVGIGPSCVKKVFGMTQLQYLHSTGVAA